MSVAIPQFMKKIQKSGAAPPLILATSRHCFESNLKSQLIGLEREKYMACWAFGF
jgi:hypothetical protein